MMRRYRTPSPTRYSASDSPFAPTKLPELRTPEKCNNTPIEPPVNSGKPTNPFPMTVASYVLKTPFKGGQGFDPVCEPAPRKNRVLKAIRI
jgi:hypothetical protein